MKDINNIELFFDIEKKKSGNYVRSFIGKYALIDFVFDKPGYSSIIPARVIDFDGEVLSVSFHDDGTLETRLNWTDQEEGDLFKDFEGKIKLEDLNWIYEYSNNLDLLGLNDDFIGRDCIFTNINDIELNGKIVEFDNYTILIEILVDGQKSDLMIPLIFVSSISFIE